MQFLLKRPLYLPLVGLLLCLVYIALSIRSPEPTTDLQVQPSIDDVCSINEDLTQECVHVDLHDVDADDAEPLTEPPAPAVPVPKAAAPLPVTFVTAASSNHFCALEAMLYIFQELKTQVSVAFPRLVVYNLGLNAHQERVLANLHRHGYFDELATLDYKRYPDFWDVRKNRGEYAWKPGAVKEVQQKYGGIIIWLDTGDVPNALFIENMPTFIREHGFWSPRSTGFMGAKFNHIGLFRYFHASRKQYASLENCNGAALGFDADNPDIVDTLIDPWYNCALHKDCIAPKGSSRQNHRQDQTAISFLALRAGYRCVEYPEFHGLTIHQDELCNDRLALLHRNGKLLTPSSYVPNTVHNI
ncbi:hypothetical protein BC940DRAFT_320708 [Gongronella butleri]|nr:hypothetical protein BC940DRAFT_320708 [Gongronella butleri]